MAKADDGDGDGDDGGAPVPDLSRRQLLALVGGGALGAGALRVAYELLGYGTVTGTNVTEQRLGPYVRRRLGPSAFEHARGASRLSFDGDSVELEDAAGTRRTISLRDADPDDVARRGAAFGLGEPLAALAADVGALAAGDVTVDATDYGSFFERLAGANTRPTTVAALRGAGFRRPDRAALRAFTGSDPSDVRALVTGLAEGFRDGTHFDASRYVVGNVQDHVLRDAVRLRRGLEAPSTFEALAAGDVGMYCWEYALRSLEAFHAVAPHRQTVPVFGAIVGDRCHNHVYTGLGSVVRESGELRVPLTFLDYSHATMYDTYHLRGVLGDGVDAYDERHRVTGVRYRNPYAFTYGY